MWHTEIVDIVIIVTMIDNNLFPGVVDSESYLIFFSVDNCTVHMVIEFFL